MGPETMSAPHGESARHLRFARWSSVRRRGDREALEELYLIHFDRIYSYLHLSVGNRHDAEDLTTQTFLKMLEAIGRFRWQSVPFSAWLFRIAHNLAIDHFRARRRVQPEDEVPEPPGQEESSAENQAMDSIGQAGMLTLIERLSPEQRQVLTLKFLVRLRERRGGGDPRQDRGCREVAPAPGARVAAEARQPRLAAAQSRHEAGTDTFELPD